MFFFLEVLQTAPRKDLQVILTQSHWILKVYLSSRRQKPSFPLVCNRSVINQLHKFRLFVQPLSSHPCVGHMRPTLSWNSSSILKPFFTSFYRWALPLRPQWIGHRQGSKEKAAHCQCPLPRFYDWWSNRWVIISRLLSMGILLRWHNRSFLTLDIKDFGATANIYVMLRLFKLEVFRIPLFHVIVGNREGWVSWGFYYEHKKTDRCLCQSTIKKNHPVISAHYFLQSSYTEASVLLVMQTTGLIDDV